jgi:hypothetical protein
MMRKEIGQYKNKIQKREMYMKKITFLVIVVVAAFGVFDCAMAGDIDTPLPGDVNVLAPDPSIGKIAEFSGTWKGVWDNGKGRAATIVVEEINSSKVAAIYSWGPWRKDPGGWSRISGYIKDNSAIVLEGTAYYPYTITLILKKNNRILAEWKKDNNILTANFYKQQSPVFVKNIQIEEAIIPLPDDIKITPPAEDLPKDLAAFSGRWDGSWDFSMKAMFIIEYIDDKEAKIIYAWNGYPEYKIVKGFVRETAKVTPGSKPTIEWGDGTQFPKFVFKMNDKENISGIYELNGIKSLIRMKKAIQ